MDFAHGVLPSHHFSLEAFNVLVTEKQDEIYTLAYLILGDKLAAEKVVQSALVQAYFDLNSGNTKPFDWLVYRALTAVIKVELRRKDRDSLEGKFISDDIHLSALNGFRGLHPDLRLIIALVDVAGLDYEQAADILGIHVRQVRRKLAQARYLMDVR